MSELKQQTEQKMLKSLESLKNELGKIRTGRAQPSILDHVMVEYYGSMVPLNQVANVTLIDARTVGVQPWAEPVYGTNGSLTSSLSSDLQQFFFFFCQKFVDFCHRFIR